MIYHVKVVYINDAFEKHVLSENIYINTSDIVLPMMKYHQPLLKLLTILELQEYLNLMAHGMRQGTRRPNTVLSKKDIRNRKMDLLLPIIFAITPIDGLCYRVIKSLILEEFWVEER